MARQDHAYMKIELDFFFGDPRFLDLTSAARCVYLGLWGIAIEQRSERLRPEIGSRYLAHRLQIDQRSVKDALQKCCKNALIKIEHDGSIIITGVKDRHSKLGGWADPFATHSGAECDPSRVEKSRVEQSREEKETTIVVKKDVYCEVKPTIPCDQVIETEPVKTDTEVKRLQVFWKLAVKGAGGGRNGTVTKEDIEKAKEWLELNQDIDVKEIESDMVKFLNHPHVGYGQLDSGMTRIKPTLGNFCKHYGMIGQEIQTPKSKEKYTGWDPDTDPTFKEPSDEEWADMEKPIPPNPNFKPLPRMELPPRE